MAYLLVLKGTNAKQSLTLDKDRTLMGRNASCDVVFPANDFAVSREHACLVRDKGKFFLEDLGSRNGTYLNDSKIAGRVVLKDSDKIKICDFLYSFHETSPTKKLPLPEDFRSEQTIDEPDDFSTFEAAVSNSSHLILETQPAERLRALVDITNNLCKTLDLDRLLPKIVDSLFLLFKQADRCFIILRDEVTERGKVIDRLIPKVIKTRTIQDETQASFSRSIVRECIKTLQAFLSDDAGADDRFKMAQSIADFRIRSVMCAPLISQDNKAIGVIQLDTQNRSKKFIQDDLGLLLAVANQAAVALENARLHEDQLAQEGMRKALEVAREVQLSFLPRDVPKVSGYEFSAHYEPAQAIGGDYYDFIRLSTQNQRWAITLGDVAGKGVPAALLMAKLSSDARFSLMSDSDPAKAIMVLNNSLYPNTSRMDRFVTLAAAVLDPVTHTVTLVNAGHPTPLLIRKGVLQPEDARSKEIIGLPLGVMEDYTYESHQIQLLAGDVLLLFSDGVTDAMDKENVQINMQAIHSALSDGELGPKALVERIEKNLHQYSAGRSQHDDITLVCFGRNEQ